MSNNIDYDGGTLSVDDKVIDKPYKNVIKSHLIVYFYSGTHHYMVKVLNLVTLYS